MVALFSVLLIAPEADARRLGGGRSFGKQSDLIKRDAARPPAQSGQQAAAPPANNAAAGAAGGRSWMGPIAGIAAGLGLAALASYLGLGEEFATILLMALVVFAVLIAVRMFMARRRQGGGVAGQPRAAYAGAGAGGSAAGGNTAFRQSPAQGGQPWARPQNSLLGASAVPQPAQPVAQSADVPANFDVDRFIHAAKVYFVRLQAAFDSNRADDLREFTSPEMYAELSLELKQRDQAPQSTDVVTLNARLLGVERTGPNDETELASVRFDGMLRESSEAAAAPFVEVWNFARPVDRSAGWVLAGIQQVANG